MLLVRGKQPVCQDFSDLEGKKVGTAGASGGMRLSVLKMLEKNGVSTDNVDLIANGVYQTAYASLTSGEVDATLPRYFLPHGACSRIPESLLWNISVSGTR